MPNIRERIAASTANLSSARDQKRPVTTGTPHIPKTAPGMMAALASAEARIKALEAGTLASEIKISEVHPNPRQPRRRMREEPIDALAQSIAEVGLMQPVVVRAIERKGKKCYELVMGERRLRAHKILGRETIPALVTNLSPDESALWALVENVAREDLTDYEVYLGIKAFDATFSSRSAFIKALGVSRKQFYRLLAFDELPPFILESLTTQPERLGANAAEEIKSVLGGCDEPEEAQGLLEHIWLGYLAGDLHQHEIAANLRLQLKRPQRGAKPAAARAVTPITVKGKKVGSISRSHSALTIRVATKSLDEKQEAKLVEFLQKLW